MRKVNRTSMVINDERIKQLKDLFPEAFTEDAIDFDRLRQALGDHVDSRPERYSFSWAGKRDAMQAAQIPSRATLVPDYDQSVNFDATQNVFIEGDNLEVLKLLTRPYFGRVKMIYIDPPYNTGGDFVYPDNYSDPLDTYLRMTGQKNGNGDLLTTNAETSGRFHSSWLSMMYPRLVLARQLLVPDGAIFISIDDGEVANLRLLMNEVFGEDNFIAQFVWKSRQFPDARSTTKVSTDHEYILAYSRHSDFSLRGTERDETKFSNPDSDPRGPWMSRSMLGLATAEQRPNLHYDIVNPKTGIAYPPPPATGWRYEQSRMNELISEGKVLFPAKPSGRPREKKFRSELTDQFISFPSIIDDVFTAHGTAEIRDIFGFQAFDFPKPVELLKRLIEQITDDEDIILDFFAGSASTAQAMYELNRADEQNRRFILVQLPEPISSGDYATLSELARERIRRTVTQIREENAQQLPDNYVQDLGFRAFRLTRSNYRPDPDPESMSEEEYRVQLTMFAESLLVDDWDAGDVIYEVALKEGYGLNIRIEDVPIDDNTVYHVTDPDKDQSFFICLDETLRPDIADALGLTQDDLFICHDKALDDTLAANLALQARLLTL